MNPVIWEIVRDMTAKCFDIPATAVLPGTHFAKDLDQSMELTELVMDVEERFGIHADDRSWSEVQTVGDMAVLVERHVGPEWPHGDTVWPPAPRITE